MFAFGERCVLRGSTLIGMMKHKFPFLGTVLLVFVTAFSLFGPLIVPYSETQRFMKSEVEHVWFASVSHDLSAKVSAADGISFTASDRAAYTLAKARGLDGFESGGVFWTVESIASGTAVLHTSDKADAVLITDLSFIPYGGGEVPDHKTKIGLVRSALPEILSDGGVIYRGSEPYMLVTRLTIVMSSPDTAVSAEFADALTAALEADESEFEYDGTSYGLTAESGGYAVTAEREITLLDIYAEPSLSHPLGTDGNGMDILTRLMYGGRVSLCVGFTAVMLQLVIGTMIGGVSGHFGGIADTLLMRLVEVVSCIPTTPLFLIFGSVMTEMKAGTSVRVRLLILMLGLTGWTGIARVVRGQILRLRETEFMQAAEALGLRTSRRIVHHLIPNVMGQIIVCGASGLGNVILTEAALSFLGLGIRYPSASWGNMVSSVTDTHVLTNCPFAWIPAGMLILVTVLGFNFIGDHVRDRLDR